MKLDDSLKHVAKVDNQWSIIQSIYLIDESSKRFWHARSPEQFVTRQYQDTILEVLSQAYEFAIE